MKKLGEKAYNEIRTWMYRNARPLDLALWQFYFENGSREEVVRRLGFYQNVDGGFGNGIEPDCWNPESSPYGTLNAIGILREIGFLDMSHPVLLGIVRFLECGAHSSPTGWHFSIPSNDNWPRAPWWTYSEKSNQVQDLGITAPLCSFILRYGDRQSELFERVCGYVDNILENVSHTEDFGEMGVEGLAVLAEDIEVSGLSGRFDCSVIRAGMADHINRSIERDPDQWQFYTHRPSEFIGSPASPFYPGNEEIVAKELDYLIDTRNQDGVWNITWTWFDLMEQYAREFAVAENWWMVAGAIKKVLFLKNFDRI